MLYYCIGDDDELEWYEGIVGDVNGGGTENPDFLIRYTGFAEVFLFSYCELREGKIKPLPVSVEMFLGDKVSQRFEDEKHHQSWWENGRIVSVVEGSDEGNPEFVLEFNCETLSDEESDSEEENFQAGKICCVHLFEDYLNNDLRFI